MRVAPRRTVLPPCAARGVALFRSVFAARSAEPGGRRTRFAPLVLQFVQFLLQIRFALLQIFQLAIPVINVRGVVLHHGGEVKTAVPVFLDVVLRSRNRFVGSTDLAQNLLRAPAPVLFVVFSPLSLLPPAPPALLPPPPPPT